MRYTIQAADKLGAALLQFSMLLDCSSGSERLHGPDMWGWRPIADVMLHRCPSNAFLEGRLRIACSFPSAVDHKKVLTVEAKDKLGNLVRMPL